MSELSERAAFEAFWSGNMNLQEMDLHRFGDDYACHETNRAWMTWQAACAAPAQELSALPELPPLPVPWITDGGRNVQAEARHHYAEDQMQDYARAFGLLCRQQGGSDAARLDMLDGENFVSLNCYVQVYGHQGAPLDTERKFYVVELESQIETVEGATVREAIDAAIAAIQAQAGDEKGGAA